MKSRIAGLVLMVHSAVVAALASPPLAIWSADPVRPGELALVQGTNWKGVETVQVRRSGGDGQSLEPVASNVRSLRFLIPRAWPLDIYHCTVETPAGSCQWRLNAPEPWWFQADQGQAGTPGGWLRVFGRCLALAAGAQIELRHAAGKIPLTLKTSGCWSLEVTLPRDLPPGSYAVWLHNGLGRERNEAQWEEVGPLEIKADSAFWGNFQVSLEAFGAKAEDDLDDSEAFRKALRALERNGGGTLRFAAGRYRFAGEFDIPVNVRLIGCGANATYLCWNDESAPPEAFLRSPGHLVVEDLGLYAFRYRCGLKVQGEGEATARDVAIRRVRVRFAPFSVRGLSPAEEGARGIEAAGGSVFALAADNVQIVDCDITAPAGALIAMEGNDLVCMGTRVRGETYGRCSFGTGRRLLVEGNTFSSCTAYAVRACDVWFARNRLSDNYREFREAFSTDGTGDGPGDVELLAVHGTRMKIRAAAGRTTPLKVGVAVRILDGPGAGQWREVKAYDGTNVEIDRPWDVVPDHTSALAIGNAMRHHLVIENVASDTGVAVQLFGNALECVVAGNRSTRSGGFRVWGRQVGPGSAPGWYVQMEDNVIDEAYGTEGPEMDAGLSSLEAIGDLGSPHYAGPTIRGILIRNNDLSMFATINVRRRVRDVVVEGNRVSAPARSVLREMADQQSGVFLFGNKEQ